MASLVQVESCWELPPPQELGGGHPFLMFVCLAILLDQRDTILNNQMQFDEIHMHFDRISRQRK